MSRPPCDWCGGPMPATARRDAITCTKRCRQARHRLHRHVSPRRSRRDTSSAAAAYPSPGSPRRLAYADPPYPGLAHYYRDHPDYAGEVDHAALLSRLATYDGWALSTSAGALPAVLAEAVAQDLPVRVAAWVRGERAHATARYPLNAWEPVIYVPVASAVERDPSRLEGCVDARHVAPRRGAGDTRRVDVLSHGVSPMLTLPGRVIGAKPPAFCRWMFDLVGATPADTLDDLFPGSGIVGKAWQVFCGNETARVAG